MNYSSEQLPNGRWGIYGQGKLLATIGCYSTCQKILSLLAKRKSHDSNNSQAVSSLQGAPQQLVEIAGSHVDKNQTAA